MWRTEQEHTSCQVEILKTQLKRDGVQERYQRSHFCEFPADGSTVTCDFKNGVPFGSGTLKDSKRRYFDVEYWADVSIRDGAKPVKYELSSQPVMMGYYSQVNQI